ncbi:Phospholipase/carboxylesterase [Fomitopsis serialis]|uniref:Phospholipase/carboxylesterase n=1 Tax=Fomitopsis serialis TaxID=139415 RepID=UPI0020086DEC|nr:Phospholipase/carboxylesterase [Neoantrodia serialis]KAH9927302.1 Phospholipase/carboxylesterase [Neoantrodia serialis]
MARVTFTPQPLEVLTVPAREKHTATVIFVHGLGDSGHSWQRLADSLTRDPELQHIKYIFPHAPVMAITANFGMRMPAWYDVVSFKSTAPEDNDDFGMLRSMASLGALVEREVTAGIPPDRIVFGGFSQGAAMTLLTGLSYEHKLGGLIVMSGRLRLGKKVKLLLHASNIHTPIFWGHGRNDPLVTYEMGMWSIQYMRTEYGLTDADPDAPEKGGLALHIYDAVHTVPDEELEDVKEWVKRVLPARQAVVSAQG